MRVTQLCLVACALSLQASARADLVSNGGFESPVVPGNFQSRPSGSSIGAWTVSSGNVDHIHQLWAAAEGLQSVDLNGSGAGGVRQTLTTVAAQQYRIRFAVSENFFGVGDKSMDLFWGGSIVDSITITHDAARTALDMRWYYLQYDVTATSSSTVLQFTSTTGAMNGSQGNATFYGPALDDVSVNPIPSPTAAAMIGMVGLLASRRRRFEVPVQRSAPLSDDAAASPARRRQTKRRRPASEQSANQTNT